VLTTREDELEAKAEEIADEAVKGYEKVLPPHVIAEMRRLLIFDMLVTDEGRATLRLCLDDPIVAKSDDVATAAVGPAAIPTPAKKQGRGGP